MVYALDGTVIQTERLTGDMGSESISDRSCIGNPHIGCINSSTEFVRPCKSPTSATETDLKKTDNKKCVGIAESCVPDVNGTSNLFSNFECFSDSTIEGQFTDPDCSFSSEDFSHFIEFTDSDRSCPVEWKTFEGNMWSNEQNNSTISHEEHVPDQSADNNLWPSHSSAKDNEKTKETIKSCFPAIPVQCSTESVKRLDQFFDLNSDESNEDGEKQKKSCPIHWKYFQSDDCTLSSRYPWEESHCYERLLSSLRIDPSRKDLSAGSVDLIDDADQEKGDSLWITSELTSCNSKSLIQTKLSDTSSTGRGKNLTYHVFVNWTQVNGTSLCLTVPNERKSFFFK